MPAYNPGKHLESAVLSILAQKFTDFEFLILDDGTQDGSLAVLETLRDPRIKLIRNPHNLGLVETLNIGLREAKGRYIARMDADDIAHPDRLGKQFKLMQSKPDIAILGTWSRTIGDGIASWETHYPVDHAAIVSQMLFNTGLTHPSVMLDAQKLQNHSLTYSSTNIHAEDYDLWTRACRFVKLANLPEVLLDYRVHPTQVSSSHQDKQRQSARKIREALIRSLGLDPEPSETALHHRISEYDWPRDSDFMQTSYRWLRKMSQSIAKINPELKHAVHKMTKDKIIEMHRHVYQRKRRLQLEMIKFTY